MINKNYIPIGFQCTVKKVIKEMNIEDKTLPFDWMLSSPKFIYEILYLLLNDMPINELVKNHFFKCTNKASFSSVENYIVDPMGESLYNEKYDVIFPHDTYDDETIQKYIRRFERLYNLIKNSENLIYLYISPSSELVGNFTIDSRYILTDVNKYLIKIYDLIKENSNSTFKFKVLSTYGDKIEYDNIEFIYINPTNHWEYLIQECINKLI
jgi:hypothetical protein